MSVEKILGFRTAQFSYSLFGFVPQQGKEKPEKDIRDYGYNDKDKKTESRPCKKETRDDPPCPSPGEKEPHPYEPRDKGPRK